MQTHVTVCHHSPQVLSFSSCSPSRFLSIPGLPHSMLNRLAGGGGGGLPNNVVTGTVFLGVSGQSLPLGEEVGSSVCHMSTSRSVSIEGKHSL